MRGPRVAVALDYASADDARGFVAKVSPQRCRLKVGLELYTATGPTFVSELVGSGFGVFLDLKFHDIPNTVERACRQAAMLGVEMLTVHCLGGQAMLAAALRGARDAGEDGRTDERNSSDEEGRPGERSSSKSSSSNIRSRPRILGVTLLTSLSDNDAQEIGLVGNIGERALALAELARDAGLDGVICAPTEVQALRQRFGKDFLLVTPGVRPAGAQSDDQQRVLAPSEAIARGADLLVVGRPITRSDDPRIALDRILDELARK